MYKSLVNNNPTVATFLNLGKADTVNYVILYETLKYYGLHDKTLQLINGYSTERIQRTKINDKISDHEFLDFGLPQDRILRPNLLIIYINDISVIRWK